MPRLWLLSGSGAATPRHLLSPPDMTPRLQRGVHPVLVERAQVSFPWGSFATQDVGVQGTACCSSGEVCAAGETVLGMRRLGMIWLPGVS